MKDRVSVFPANQMIEPYWLTDDSLAQLRALRLWHWKEYVRLQRALETTHGIGQHVGDAHLDVKDMQRHRGRIKYRMNHHMRATQTLNDLFPEPFDTAQRDLEIEQAHEQHKEHTDGGCGISRR